MNVCPNCGNRVEDGVRFCNVCGTTIPMNVTESEPIQVTPAAENQQVTCGICGTVNPVYATQCSVCGAYLGEEPVATGAQEPARDTMESARELGGKVADTAKELGGKAAVVAKDVGGKAAVAAKDFGGKAVVAMKKLAKKVRKSLAGKDKETLKKALIIGGGALAAVVVLIVLISVLSSGGMDYNYALYVNEDYQLSYAKLTGKGDPLEITEDGTNFRAAKMADNSKTLFYLDLNDDGDLCLYYRNATNGKKDPVLVEKNVDGSFLINPEGSRVYFTKKGNLYVSNLKKSEKIESDVDGFRLSEDGSKVLYQNDDGELYIWNGKKSVEVDSDVEDVFYYSEDFKVIYYLKDDELMLKSGSKDPVEILSDCTGCYINETETGYAMNDDGDLFYINGKKATEVDSDVTSRSIAYERAVAVYVVDGEDCYVAVKGKSYELELDDVYDLQLSSDGKTLYALVDVDDGHGDLVKISIGSKPGKVKEVDKDVYYSYMGFDGEDGFYYFKDVEEPYGTLVYDGKEVDKDVFCYNIGFLNGKPYYLKDIEDNEGTLFVGGKEIASGVYPYSIRVNTEKKTLLFINDHDYTDNCGTLSVYKSKVQEVAEDVYYSDSDYGSKDFFIMPDGEVLYFTDYDLTDGVGVLNCFNGSKSVELADDAQYFIPVYGAAN